MLSLSSNPFETNHQGTTTPASTTPVTTSASTTPQATTTTSTTPATTTTTSCPTKIVTSGTGLPADIDIPDNDGFSGAEVTIPVELNAGCGCTVANVAIAVGINFPLPVGSFGMNLLSPDGDEVILVNQPPSSASLVSENLITFDDSDPGAKDPRFLACDFGSVLAGTYFAEGDGCGEVNDDGLGKFNGKTAADDWTFQAFDFAADNTGTIVSVELTITCAE